MKVDKFIDVFIISAFTLLFASAISLATIYFTETSPIIFTNEPFPVAEEYYSRGDSIRLEIGSCTHGMKRYLINQRLRNLDTDSIIFLPNLEITSTGECNVSKSTPKLLPDDLEAGNYRFEFIFSVDGVVKNFDIVANSEPFKIRKQ